MTNDEVKAFWLKHDKKPLVQYATPRVPDVWTLTFHPGWFDESINIYRILPNDLKKFMSIEKEKEMKTIDITKPVKFRNFPSETVEVRGTLNKGHTQQLLVVVTDKNGVQFEGARYIDGRIFTYQDNPRDIINVPERVEKFICVHADCITMSLVVFTSEHEAKLHCQELPQYPLTPVKLTYEDGKLVSAEVVK